LQVLSHFSLFLLVGSTLHHTPTQTMSGSDRAPINGLGSLHFVISANGDDSDRCVCLYEGGWDGWVGWLDVGSDPPNLTKITTPNIPHTMQAALRSHVLPASALAPLLGVRFFLKSKKSSSRGDMRLTNLLSQYKNSKEKLRDRLLKAISESEGFGLR
jgi:hypothetical protein